MKIFLVKEKQARLKAITSRDNSSRLKWHSSVMLDADIAPLDDHSLLELNLCKNLKMAILNQALATVTSTNYPPHLAPRPLRTVSGMDWLGIANARLGEMFGVNPTNTPYVCPHQRNAGPNGHPYAVPGRMVNNGHVPHMNWKLLVTMIQKKHMENGKMDLKVEGDLLDLLNEIFGDKATVNVYLRDFRPVHPENPDEASASGSALDLDTLYERHNNSLLGADGTLRTVQAEGMKVTPNCPMSNFNTLCHSSRVGFKFALLEEWNLMAHYTAIFTVEVELPTVTDPSVKGRMKLNKKILTDGVSTDFEIQAGDGGTVFKCHTEFLCAHSPLFENMFKSNMKECLAGRITLAGVSSNCVKALLEYLYCWEIEAPAKDLLLAFELLKVARMYDIPDLENAMKQLLSSRDATMIELDFALDLYLFAKDLPLEVDIKMKAVQVFKLHVSELEGNEKYNQLFRDSPEVAKELCRCALST